MFFRQTSLALVFLLLVGSVGCTGKSDPTGPEGAYNQFRDGLFEGDNDKVWNRMSPDSHAYFDDQVARLRLMDEKIVRYLPPTDHKLARGQAGSVLTDEVTDGRGLFDKIFQPKGLPKDEQFKVGSQVEEIRKSEDEKTAEVITRGKQTIRLVHDEKSDEWFVSLPNSTFVTVEKTPEALNKSFQWLEKNESALDQTIEDLIEEERREREKVIADLMGYGEGDKVAN